MALRSFSPTLRAVRLATAPSSTRQRRLQSTAAAASIPKPVGAFRGGFFGFLLGTSLAAYGTYAFLLEDYRKSNETLSEDIYALQVAVQKVEAYVAGLEDKMDALEKRR